MNFDQIQNIGRKLYGPAFALESVISHKSRKVFERVLRNFFVLAISISLILTILKSFLHITDFVQFEPTVFLVTSILFFLWVTMFVFEAFYYSYYYRQNRNISPSIDFDLALILYRLPKSDVVLGFFKTGLGSLILMRCGVGLKDFREFLSKRVKVLKASDLDFTILDNRFSLKDFLLTLLEKDEALADFLFGFGVQRKEIIGVSEWIIELNQAFDEEERWWSPENLHRIKGLGESLSYGMTFELDKYERVLHSGMSGSYRVHSSYGVKELKELEAVLCRSGGADALLVGNDEAGSLSIISHLAKMIDEGTTLLPLKHKRVFLLDPNILISNNNSKSQLESEFIRIMNEAVYAGNILLVIPDLPAFVHSSSVIGVDAQNLLKPYLSGTDLQIIGLCTTEQFQQLQRNTVFTEHFEHVNIKEIDNSNTVKVLENEIIRFENKGLFFTYGAISEIADGAVRYFPDGVMPDKAIDLLSEIAPKLLSAGKKIVEKKDVLELIESKTGIPTGEVSKEERKKLLELESILHKRIIGQDEAILAISNAVRRARSGVENPNKPLGSFLFLGPTGVGKTETTKALADVFFGEKANILRLDMSEYSGRDSVAKLIGSFEGGQSGVLSSMIREHPFGVLLLDEFEKTTGEVMNVFLQILDEGFFSDMDGKRINMRNLMIIATSNAGSDLIWQIMQSGSDLTKSKDVVIDAIIKAGIFKPEFLNRFDGVILFHPLTPADLRKIATLMLNGLHNRLAERGVSLKVDDNLIDYVVSFGTDPKFGARPMNRAISDKVEEIVARKIISGEVSKGSHLVLSKEDLVA